MNEGARKIENITLIWKISSIAFVTSDAPSIFTCVSANFKHSLHLGFALTLDIFFIE